MNKKMAVMIGAAYGALALFAAAPMYLFSFQQPQPLFIKIAIGLYTLSLLPAAICAIWFKRTGGIWMILVAMLSAIALSLQEVTRYHRSEGIVVLTLSLVWWILIASIPAVIGRMILTSDGK